MKKLVFRRILMTTLVIALFSLLFTGVLFGLNDGNYNVAEATKVNSITWSTNIDNNNDIWFFVNANMSELPTQSGGGIMHFVVWQTNSSGVIQKVNGRDYEDCIWQINSETMTFDAYLSLGTYNKDYVYGCGMYLSDNDRFSIYDEPAGWPNVCNNSGCDFLSPTHKNTINTDYTISTIKYEIIDKGVTTEVSKADFVSSVSLPMTVFGKEKELSYTSIDAALSDGNTSIDLLQDYNIPESSAPLKITGNDDYTINLNSHKIYGENYSAPTSGAKNLVEFDVRSIKICDTSDKKDNLVLCDGEYSGLFYVSGYATNKNDITFENVNFNCVNYSYKSSKTNYVTIKNCTNGLRQYSRTGDLIFIYNQVDQYGFYPDPYPYVTIDGGIYVSNTGNPTIKGRFSSIEIGGGAIFNTNDKGLLSYDSSDLANSSVQIKIKDSYYSNNKISRGSEAPLSNYYDKTFIYTTNVITNFSDKLIDAGFGTNVYGQINTKAYHVEKQEGTLNYRNGRVEFVNSSTATYNLDTVQSWNFDELSYQFVGWAKKIDDYNNIISKGSNNTYDPTDFEKGYIYYAVYKYQPTNHYVYTQGRNFANTYLYCDSNFGVTSKSDYVEFDDTIFDIYADSVNCSTTAVNLYEEYSMKAIGNCYVGITSILTNTDRDTFGIYIQPSSSKDEAFIITEGDNSTLIVSVASAKGRTAGIANCSGKLTVKHVDIEVNCKSSNGYNDGYGIWSPTREVVLEGDDNSIYLNPCDYSASSCLFSKIVTIGDTIVKFTNKSNNAAKYKGNCINADTIRGYISTNCCEPYIDNAYLVNTDNEYTDYNIELNDSTKYWTLNKSTSTTGYDYLCQIEKTRPLVIDYRRYYSKIDVKSRNPINSIRELFDYSYENAKLRDDYKVEAINFDKSIYLKNDVELDLNGHCLIVSDYDAYINLNGHTLTLKNGYIETDITNRTMFKGEGYLELVNISIYNNSFKGKLAYNPNISINIKGGEYDITYSKFGGDVFIYSGYFIEDLSNHFVKREGYLFVKNSSVYGDKYYDPLYDIYPYKAAYFAVVIYNNVSYGSLNLALEQADLDFQGGDTSVKVFDMFWDETLQRNFVSTNNAITINLHGYSIDLDNYNIQTVKDLTIIGSNDSTISGNKTIFSIYNNKLTIKNTHIKQLVSTSDFIFYGLVGGDVYLYDSYIDSCVGKLSNPGIHTIEIQGGEYIFNLVDTLKKISIYNGLFKYNIKEKVTIPYGATAEVLPTTDPDYSRGFVLKVSSHYVCELLDSSNKLIKEYIAFKTCLDDVQTNYQSTTVTIVIYENVNLESDYSFDVDANISIKPIDSSEHILDFDKYTISIKGYLYLKDITIYGNNLFEVYATTRISITGCEIYQKTGASSKDYIFNVNETWTTQLIEILFTYIYVPDCTLISSVLDDGSSCGIRGNLSNSKLICKDFGGIYFVKSNASDTYLKYNNKHSINIWDLNLDNRIGYYFYYSDNPEYLIKLTTDSSIIGDLNNVDVSWYNTTDTEFELSTLSQLAGLAAICNYRIKFNYDNFSGKTIKLANDIDYSSSLTWDPINNFKGTFDGQGHTISNLYIGEVKEIGKRIGLFGNFQGDSIKNLNLTGLFDLNLNTLYANEWIQIGTIAGSSIGNIINCTSNVSVSCTVNNNAMPILYWGGLVGYFENAGIYNSCYTTNYNSSSSLKSSKIVGYSANAEIANSYVYTSYKTNTFFPLSDGTYMAKNSFIYMLYQEGLTSYTTKKLGYYNYDGEKDENVITIYDLTGNYQLTSEEVIALQKEQCSQLVELMNEIVFANDLNLRYDVELTYWHSSDDLYPVFYYGPLFDVSVDNEHLVKPLIYDEKFDFEQTREGSTFIGWTREYSSLPTLIARGSDNKYHKDSSIFENGKTYYAYFKLNNAIVATNITYKWTYGDQPIAPQVEVAIGTAIIYYYSRDDLNTRILYTPTNAGLYYLVVEVLETPIALGILKMFEIEVEKATFDTSNIYWTDSQFVYDGTEKKIELIGAFPAGLSAKCYDNVLTDAGSIMAYAIFEFDKQNYNNVPAFTHLLVIERATFDVSLIRFPNTKYTYQEGVVHELKIVGTLPDGLTVSYLNNTREEKTPQNEPQIATAIFDANWNNYYEVPNMTAKIYVNDYLTIDMSGVSYISKSYDYSPGVERTLLITGDLPSGVTVTYENNKRSNAGVNIAKAIFAIGTVVYDTDTNEVMWYEVGEGDDKVYYNPINDLVAKLTINKLTYNLSGLEFNNLTITYDGNEHEVLLTGTEFIPEGVQAIYSNNKLTEAGAVYASVSFVGDFENYFEIKTRYATLTIEKATYDMSNVLFENASYVYDGTKKIIQISGDLPEGVTVLYGTDGTAASTSTGATTVGSIKIIAYFFGDTKNYNLIPNMSASLSITKATYDMSNVKFKDAVYAYDGFVKKLVITGELPEGLRVSYSANTLSKVGSIEVTAKFIGDSVNYNSVTQMKATLTIIKATYDMSNVKFENVSYVYTGETRTLLITGDLPTGVSVSYLDNQLINAGTNTATAIFSVDERFYNPIKNMVATITITKAIYDMSNIKFESQRFVFDGTAHTLLLVGDLPKGVKAVYETNTRTLVGDNTAVVKFIIENDNYEPIEEMHAVIYVDKATYDMSDVVFKDTTIVYDGTEKVLVINGVLPNGVTVSYTTNRLTSVGAVTVTAKFSGNTSTHNPISNMVATLTIIKADYDMSKVVFEDVSYKYDGFEKQLTCIGIFPAGVNVSYTPNTLTKPGELYVVATFTISDYINYNEIESRTAKLTIEKLDYDMSDIVFQGGTYVYDGKERRVEIDGNLPEGVKVEYSMNKLTNVGQVIATAAFYGDQFHNDIPSMTTTLTITKASFNLSEISFSGGSFLYDGMKHSIYISGTLPKGAYAKYEGNEQVNPGSYLVKAIIAGDEKNYFSEEFSATLVIIPTKIESEKYRDVTYVFVEAEDGLTQDLTIDYSYTYESDISDSRFPKAFTSQVALYEKVGAVFTLSLYGTDENGNKIEYQPSEVSSNGKIKVRFLLPKGIAFNEIISIYNIHSDTDVQKIEFTRQDLDEEGYLNLEVDKLSDFAFVISNPDYKKNMIIRLFLYCLAVVVGIYLIISLEFLIWRKTNKGFKFMIPLFRLRSRILFKSKWNNVEIRDQNFTGEKEEKKKKKDKNK